MSTKQFHGTVKVSLEYYVCEEDKDEITEMMACAAEQVLEMKRRGWEVKSFMPVIEELKPKESEDE